MNYLTTQIRTLIGDSTVATAAGMTSAEWANHIFITYDLQQFTGSINIGRLPLVAIQELTANYQSEATSLNEMGGTVTCAWTIRIMTNAFGNRRENNYAYLQRVKQAMLKKIFQDYSTEMRVIDQANSTINPMATYIDITIEAEHTFTDGFNEE